MLQIIAAVNHMCFLSEGKAGLPSDFIKSLFWRD